ncbi:hypothetical protein AAHC03_020945 [Spirometra sp. Aus1]
MVANNKVFEHPIAEYYSQLVLACQSTLAPTHIIAGTSAFSRSFMPRVAVTLNSSLISDVLAVLSPDTFQRPIYAGNALMTLQSLDKVICLTVRETSFTPTEPGNNKAPIESLDHEIGEYNNVKFIKHTISKKDRPGLNEAKIVISGGRALKSKENFQLLYTLADRLGAAVGATRAAVDAGFVDNELQIGQTGKVVAPELYIAVGISGAIQHLAGMKESKVIVAINKDPEAPIFQCYAQPRLSALQSIGLRERGWLLARVGVASRRGSAAGNSLVFSGHEFGRTSPVGHTTLHQDHSNFSSPCDSST